MIADLARSRLNGTALAQIRELLGDDDLAAVSTWADEIRSQRPETAGWHFVDIPWNADGFSEQRDCYRPDPKHPESLQDHHNCVVDRIEIFRGVLANRYAPKAARIEALKFLVHFVADLHQPLHAIGAARGGNEIHIVEFGSSQCGARPCNLHLAWDVDLIQHSHLPENGYIQRLEKLISSERLARTGGGTPQDWANESLHLAHQVWLNEGGNLDEAYYRRNIGTVDRQLALAGVRLAALLKESLANDH